MNAEMFLDSSIWNDSAFRDCEESISRYKDIFIESLNRPQLSLQPLVISPQENMLAQSSNISQLEMAANFTKFDDAHRNGSVYPNDFSSDSIPSTASDDVLGYLARVVCIFGIAGNLLNLYVLTRRRMRRSMMDHMERCAQLGLISLAVSDLVLCAAHLVHSVALVGSSQLVAYTRHSQFPLLLLSVYGEGILNWLSLSGTFLTVVVAVGRFLVVCRPLHARSLISLKGTKAALVGAWFLALLFNLPRFFHYEMAEYPSCTEKCPCTFKTREVGWLYRNQKKVLLIYKFAYFILGVTCPLLLLVVCNACLITALRRSRELQDSCVADDPTRRRNRQTSRNRITPTLICLVAAFILLVGPSEIVTFLRDEKPAVANFAGFRMAVELTNFFQLINYAANFILYCTVNADFRKVCLDIVSCKRRKRGGRNNTDFFSEVDQGRFQIRENSVRKTLPCWRRTRTEDGRRKGCYHGQFGREVSRASQTCLTSCGQKYQNSKVGVEDVKI